MAFLVGSRPISEITEVKPSTELRNITLGSIKLIALSLIQLMKAAHLHIERKKTREIGGMDKEIF